MENHTYNKPKMYTLFFSFTLLLFDTTSYKRYYIWHIYVSLYHIYIYDLQIKPYVNVVPTNKKNQNINDIRELFTICQSYFNNAL